MDKEDVIYIMAYYSAIKKNEILPFETTWIDLEGIMLSEISQTEKDTDRQTCTAAIFTIAKTCK